MKEYIVTLKSHNDLESFYNDMETPGGCECIPEREVECCNRRSISRNTEYLLSLEEAETLKDDPRVLDVTPKELADSIQIRPCWTQTSSDFNKSGTSASTNRNWGLYRCILGSQVSNWGSNGTVDASATITITSSGKNVDFVLVDGHVDPSHPEFSVNPDGTGGTRVIQYNWYQHTNELGYGANGTYTYPSGSGLLNSDDNHGMHVCGTAVGNTQGWARDANIYNISLYSSNPNSLARAPYTFDYIRAWHNKKSINPVTGIRNPTIINNSWGSSYTIPKSNITTIIYRGTTYNSPFTDSQLRSYGIVDFDGSNVYVQAYFTPYIADVEDAVNSGIIFVGAAGNESTKIDVEGGLDYGNRLIAGGFSYFYNRGSWATSASRSGVGGQRLSVCVGAVSSLVNESKATFSNCGPRVDVYAPGVNIISSLHTSGGTASLVNDSRNSSYKLGKYQGTSMASPQVCGVLACLLEQFPTMNQADVHQYLNLTSTKNQIISTNGGYTDNTDLQGSDNEYLFYKLERPLTGVLSNRGTYKNRPTTGNAYPRVRMK